MKNIFVIVLNWNGKKDTLDCLDSLFKIDFLNFQVIVVDNGSSDDSVNAIRVAFPQVFLIETGKNLGFAEGNNVGIRHALGKGADFLFLLNNDTIIDSQILNAFMAAAIENPTAGIWGAKIYLHSNREIFDHLGGQWNSQKGVFDLIALRETDDGRKWEKSMECDYACGAALFIKREVFETVGLLEPKFFLIWEEADFCFRARRAGFLTLFCPKAKLWHKVSASFIGGKPHTTYFWWRNRLLWITRNCSKSEKRRLFLRIILPDALHMLKLLYLKRTQLFFLKAFKSPQELQLRREKILKYRAALSGIKDYLLKNFGNGPDWIYIRK